MKTRRIEKNTNVKLTAVSIFEHKLGGEDKKRFLAELWEVGSHAYRLFSGDKSAWIRAISIELEKLENPELFGE